ncbi:MAG: DNA polymerase III subunit beta [Patescibacteria group bacterium]|nr:DNA polymerase III subunit beta [Patescibacteria group bacterium]MDD5715976.1 DNA polymerase III subunit beta [Patescibacteria group bacterium]
MRVICTQENLARGLQMVSHIASKNVSLPILNNVLLKAEKGALRLLATNLEIGAECSIRGKVEREGAISVQARVLHDYINLLPRENVTLEVREDNLTISCSNAKTSMKGLGASEFPLIPVVEAKQDFRIPATELKTALTSVSLAVAYDETRPEISGVLFKLEGEAVTFVATDSYRLAEKKVPLEKQSAGNYSLIVPGRTVQEVMRVLSDGTEEVEIQSNENQILFSIGELKLTSRIVEGQYPDYQQIIPQESRTRVRVPLTEFTNTVRRASLFCKQGGNDIILKVDAKAGKITVTAANLQVGESEAHQDAAVEGEDNTIVFNYRFLLDGLQNIQSEECILEITTSTSPGVIRPAGKEQYLYIIMPIKQ